MRPTTSGRAGSPPSNSNATSEPITPKRQFRQAARRNRRLLRIADENNQRRPAFEAEQKADHHAVDPLQHFHR